MKNLLNCHSVGLHSFPISFDHGLYRRVFYADTNHNLYKPCEIAIHPHHVDIKITVLDGVLTNPIYKVSKDKGDVYNKFHWDSHILNGNGGFKFIETERLELDSIRSYFNGQSVIMKACELHTVYVERGRKCVWLIEESKPTCDYTAINYSIHDLTKWTPTGLYVEIGEDVKTRYIGEYLDKI